MKTPYINKKSKLRTKYIVLSIIASLIIICLCGCAPSAKPEASQVIQQGSPSIVINPNCKENCGGATITTGAVSAEAKSEISQPIEQTTKSQIYIFYLALLAIVLIGVAYAIYRYKKYGKII